MDYGTRSSLIGALADEFTKTSNELGVEKSNYIENTSTLVSAGVDDLSLETLRKTKQEIIRQTEAAKKSKEATKDQVLAHLKVAELCVDEVIKQKNSKRSLK